MKPIMLQGHERPLTQIKYNRDGDLLLSVAKDSKPNVWHSHNGERLGTLNGHGSNTVCWCVDISWDSIRVVTGAADSARVWDTETGKMLHIVETPTAVRTINFDVSGNIAVLSTDATMGKTCSLCWLDLRDSNQMKNGTPYQRTEVPDTKITAAVINGYNDWIFTGHDNGEMRRYDFNTGERIEGEEGRHDNTVMDLQLSKDTTMLVSSSKDSTAKLWDASTMTQLKSYKTNTNVNSAAISPIFDQVILGGGQEAMSVTTTSTRVGKFEVRFFHLVFEAEIGRVKGHFGPINTVAFHPDGHSFASGGEDGYIRLHNFDDDYYKFEYTY